MTVIDLAECRDREQRHEELIALIDELHSLAQLRLTPATLVQMRALHKRIGFTFSNQSLSTFTLGLLP